MAVTRMLASVSDLATLLRITIPDGDLYSAMIVQQASNAVRDEARQPDWVRREAPDDVLAVGQVEAPEAARDITLWVASRAHADPRNRSRRTSGPISESFFENGVYGLELKPDEIARLDTLRPVQARNGLWTLPITHGPYANDPVLVPTSPDFGNFYIADGDQFPYGTP